MSRSQAVAHLTVVHGLLVIIKGGTLIAHDDTGTVNRVVRPGPDGTYRFTDVVEGR